MLENKQLLLRGSNLANTNWVIGAVVYTGQETKIMLNQGAHGIIYKQSQLEKLMNKVCVYLIMFQSILCLIMAICGALFVEKYAETTGINGPAKAEYLYYTNSESEDSSFNAARRAI